MTPLTQAKILRVLQGQEFERVGGNEAIKADVRVIAATNRDLEQMVAEGTFRADLYYRLNVFTIRLPPLRERGDDMPLLAEHFVRRFGRELRQGRRGRSPRRRWSLLCRYPWPGNVRELQSVVKQALLGPPGRSILPEFLPTFIRQWSNDAAGASAFDFGGLTGFVEGHLKAGSTGLYADFQRLTDRHLFALVLRHTNGNLSKAAQVLGITRATLRAKLATLGMTSDGASAAINADATPIE